MQNSVNHLSVKKTISEAWQKSKNFKSPFLLAILIYFSIQFGLEFINASLSNNTRIIINILNHITSLLLLWSLTYLGLLCATEQAVGLKNIKNIFQLKTLLKLYGTYILSQLPIFAIYIVIFIRIYSQSSYSYADTWYNFSNFLIFFFLLTWLYLYLRLSLTNGLIMLERNSLVLAVKTSFWKTKHNLIKLFLLFILNLIIAVCSALPILLSVYLINNYGLIGIASLVPMSLGLVWSIPYLFVNYGVVYKNLFNTTAINIS